MAEMAAPAALTAQIDGTRRLALTVSAIEPVTPQTTRFTLTGPDLVGFEHQPGQDLMLWLEAEGGRKLYRRYTIRDLDRGAGKATIEIAAHDGDGPGARWTASVRSGDLVEAVGPRGKITLRDAPWHLFIGDNAFVPAAFAMLEAVEPPARGHAIFEVADAREEQSIETTGPVAISWIHRGPAAPGDATALVKAAKVAELPSGPGHVYIGAEARVVLAIRDALKARGIPLDRMAPKAYWGLGKPNADRGEPDKLPDADG